MLVGQRVEKTRYLGARVGRGIDLRTDVWDPILATLKASVQRWKGFGLTPPGRARVARTLLLSKMWYLASCFPLPDSVAAEAERLIHEFLWWRQSERRVVQPRLASGVCHLPERLGGL